MASKLNRKPLLYSTELSEYIRMEGELRTTSTLLLKGRFSGKLFSSSHITIDKGAIADPCSIETGSLSVAGELRGSAKASVYIDLQDGAVVRADIEAPSIRVSEASRYDGRIKMPGIGD
jgi:cytoskeletal protein CcmA (bactofilin family)